MESESKPRGKKIRRACDSFSFTSCAALHVGLGFEVITREVISPLLAVQSMLCNYLGVATESKRDVVFASLKYLSQHC